MQQPVKIGISIGDINGIGPEVIIKTFLNPRLFRHCTPVIYAAPKVLAAHKAVITDQHIKIANISDESKAVPGRINIIRAFEDNIKVNFGKVSERSGRAASQSLHKAVHALKAGKIDALVTAPIHKEAMKKAGFQYPGHTEYLQAELDGHSLMLMVSDNIRIALATAHVPVKEISPLITRERILEKIFILEKTLQQDFGIEKPLIAVLGLNPHAGEAGVLGIEEKKVIRPAVEAAKKKGVFVNGPFPADGFFGAGEFRKYDAILAMYHDQGLIPFKLLSFGEGVNFTGGLNAIRTSPDHGTAFDIAGQNKANPASFRHAVFTAIDIVRTRRAFLDAHANPLPRRTGKMKEFASDDDVPTNAST